MVGKRIELVSRHCSGDEMDPYERLFGDAIKGDPTLFAREDGVEAAPWSRSSALRRRYMNMSRTHLGVQRSGSVHRRRWLA